MRVLVVEDDPTIASFVAKGLHEAGYAVDVASDGDRGLQLVLHEPYDAAVLDVMLPGRDGFELCGLLREGGATPIIMLTARSQKADKLKGLALGADDYVTKPFSMHEVTARIRALLAKKQLERTALSNEMVVLTEDRMHFWGQLQEMAGVRIPQAVQDSVAERLELDFDTRAATLRAEYESRLAELKAEYPRIIARSMADGLLKASGSPVDVAATVQSAVTPLLGGTMPPIAPGAAGAPVAPPKTNGHAAAAAAPAAAAAVGEEESLGMEPYVDSENCTTCDECTKLNKKMFAYDADKHAYVKDAKAGTFAQLVQAAEACPSGSIHPGTPLNPKEKDLAKWIERAKPFN